MRFIGVTVILVLLLVGYLRADEVADVSDDSKIIHIIADAWSGHANADGTGAFYDVMRWVYEPLGYTVLHRVVPTKRAVAMINKGDNVDIMLADWHYRYLKRGGIYLPEKVLTPETPLAMEYVIAVFPPDSNKTWAQIRQNNTSRVGWVRGYNYQWHLGLEQHSITRVLNNVQGVKMLYKGNLDCFFDDRDVFDHMLSVAPFGEVSLRQEVVMTRKLYPVYHNAERGRHLMAIYERRMAELIASEAIYPFYHKYNKDYREAEEQELEPLL